LERHLRLLSTERRRRIGRRFTLWWIFTIPSCGLYGLGGVIIGTMLGAYVFKHIPNRIFRYIVYAYICISGFIILITN
jgi:uncharacterized membrane protein YfcA